MALNVLVVDDSAVVRSIILKTLRLAGVDVGEVHEAGNGQEGLAILEKQWIDVALVDINMPVMDGEQMIENVRRNPLWADLPVVVISTEGSETRVRHLEELGARFIRKPFPPEALRRVIREITGVDHESRT